MKFGWFCGGFGGGLSIGFGCMPYFCSRYCAAFTLMLVNQASTPMPTIAVMVPAKLCIRSTIRERISAPIPIAPMFRDVIISLWASTAATLAGMVVVVFLVRLFFIISRNNLFSACSSFWFFGFGIVYPPC